jgi:hypothetical protein
VEREAGRTVSDLECVRAPSVSWRYLLAHLPLLISTCTNPPGNGPSAILLYSHNTSSVREEEREREGTYGGREDGPECRTTNDERVGIFVPALDHIREQLELPDRSLYTPHTLSSIAQVDREKNETYLIPNRYRPPTGQSSPHSPSLSPPTDHCP